MSESDKNATPLGKIPDWIDERHKDAENERDSLIKQAIAKYREAGSELKAAWNAPTVQSKAGHVFSAWKSGTVGHAELIGGTAVQAVSAWAKMTLQTDSFDVLRLGNSLKNPTGWEIAQDLLRVANLVPVVCELGSAGRTLAAAKFRVPSAVKGPNIGNATRTMAEAKTVSEVLQVGQGNNCFWVSALEALRRSGQTFLLSLEGLCAAAGADMAEIREFGTTTTHFTHGEGVHYSKFVDLMRRMNVAVTETRPRFDSLHAWEEVMRANPKGVYILMYEYGEIREINGRQLGEFGHTLIGQMVDGQVLLHDAQAGLTFRGVAELMAHDRNAFTTARTPMLFIPYATTITSGSAGSTLTKAIFFLCLPIFVAGAVTGEPRALNGPPRGNAAVEPAPLGLA